MLQPNDDICLIDFNVSLAFDPSKRTSTGISEGFSPPEQYHDQNMYQRMSGIDSQQPAAKPDYQADDLTLPAEPEEEDRGETAPALKNDDEPTQPAFQTSGGLFGTADIGSNTTRRRRTEQSLEYSEYIQADPDTSRILTQTIGLGVDERSDIYSLGATFYYLLTGRKPSSQYWRNVPITECGKGISQGLGFIIKKMMCLDPKERYQNGRELKEAFDHIYDLDTEYRKYRSASRARGVLIAGLFGVSAALIVGGRYTMRRETDQRYYQYLSEARTMIEQGDYESAGSRIFDGRLLHPDRVDTYELEVQRLYSAGKYEECIRYGIGSVNNPTYTITTESDKRSIANMLYMMGNAYYETGDFKNAANCIQAAIGYYPENGSYYRDLAVILAKSGNTQEAGRYLEEAKKRGLGEDSIYMAEGEIAYAEKQYEEALDDFERVLSITSNDEIKKRTVLLCADVYKQLGPEKLKEEISFLEEQERKLGTKSGQITELLADAYARDGQYEKAIEEIARMKARGDASFQTFENLAILYQQTGDLEAARNTLEEMDRLYPNRYETYKRLAYLEADIQSRKPNEERDYYQMKDYYDRAVALCNSQDDEEMQRLNNIMEDIAKGNWFN